MVCCFDICHCISGVFLRHGCKMVPLVRACGIGIDVVKSAYIGSFKKG